LRCFQKNGKIKKAPPFEKALDFYGWCDCYFLRFKKVVRQTEDKRAVAPTFKSFNESLPAIIMNFASAPLFFLTRNFLPPISLAKRENFGKKAAVRTVGMEKLAFVADVSIKSSWGKSVYQAIFLYIRTN
jgi:hypothetical protein